MGLQRHGLEPLAPKRQADAGVQHPETDDRERDLGEPAASAALPAGGEGARRQRKQQGGLDRQRRGEQAPMGRGQQSAQPRPGDHRARRGTLTPQRRERSPDSRGGEAELRELARQRAHGRGDCGAEDVELPIAREREHHAVVEQCREPDGAGEQGQKQKGCCRATGRERGQRPAPWPRQREARQRSHCQSKPEILRECHGRSEQQARAKRSATGRRARRQPQQPELPGGQRRPLVVPERPRGIDESHEGGGRQESPAAADDTRRHRVPEQRQQHALAQQRQAQRSGGRAEQRERGRVEIAGARHQELEEVAIDDLAVQQPVALVEEDAVAAAREREDQAALAKEDEEEQQRGAGRHGETLGGRGSGRRAGQGLPAEQSSRPSSRDVWAMRRAISVASTGR